MPLFTEKQKIEVENLSVIYNQGQSNEVRSLENVNLEIYPQEYVIIFGPSGCGKSTLLYSISGLQRPTYGTVKVDGQDINKISKKEQVEFHRRKIGMIFQAFYLIPSLNIIDNVCLPKIFTGDSQKERQEVAMKLLHRFGIAEQADKFPSELSGGQKQRVAIARSLINNPDIILADEPVGNLDSKSSHNVMMILKELNEIDKKTIILVTHDPSHLAYGDKIVHMKDGKIIKIEVVEKKKSPKEKEEKVEVKEIIPLDLKLLTEAFRNLSVSQSGVLLIPFKAKQIFSHIFHDMPDEQVEMAQKKIEELMYSRLKPEDLERELDLDLEKGGAGWDKRVAKRFAARVREVLEQAEKIDFSKPESTALSLSQYLEKIAGIQFSQDQRRKLALLIRARLQNKVSVLEFLNQADLNSAKGGIGLNKKTAQKIARELELLLLLRYSG